MTERFDRPATAPYVLALLHQDLDGFVTLLREAIGHQDHPSWWQRAQRRRKLWRQRHDLMTALCVVEGRVPEDVAWSLLIPLIRPYWTDREGRTPLIAALGLQQENLALRLLDLGDCRRKGRSSLGRIVSTYVTFTTTGAPDRAPKIRWPKVSPLVAAAANGMERVVDRLLPMYPIGHREVRRALQEAQSPLNHHQAIIERLEQHLKQKSRG